MEIITTAAFDAAMANGDLATIQAYFRQPSVLANVAETEAHVVALTATHVRRIAQTMTLPNGALPWFRRPATYNQSGGTIYLLGAARRGYVDVIEWFFSHENARRMGETLAALFPLVARFWRRRSRDGHNRLVWVQVSPADPFVLEALFTSYVFCELLTAEAKQSAFEGITGLSDSVALLNVAIAHGARLDTTESVLAIYGLEALHSDMAFLVGADVSIAPTSAWSHADASDSFLTGSAANPLAHALTDAAEALDYEAFEAALADGFVDVDSRDADGLTSLMHWADFNERDAYYRYRWEFAEKPPKRMAEMLVAYSADLTLVDEHGRTALHYARRNKDVALVLLESGADPTLPDHFGVTAFDWIIDKVYEWHQWEELVELCLHSGADPLEKRPQPVWGPATDDAVAPERSLFDRLNEREEGRAFIDAQPWFFGRDETLWENWKHEAAETN